MRIIFKEKHGTYNEIPCYMVINTYQDSWGGYAEFQWDDEYLLALQHNISDQIEVYHVKKEGIYKGKANLVGWNPKQRIVKFQGVGKLVLFKSLHDFGEVKLWRVK